LGLIFSSISKGSFQFWQGLHKIKHQFKWGATFRVGNGRNCQFWQDCWLMDVPLKIHYEELYRIVRDPYSTFSDCWVDQEWFVDFHRALSSEE
jgi:hypothetical protein